MEAHSNIMNTKLFLISGDYTLLKTWLYYYIPLWLWVLHTGPVMFGWSYSAKNIIIVHDQDAEKDSKLFCQKATKALFVIEYESNLHVKA